MIRIWLPVHCLSALPGPQPYCHTNATSHFLLKEDQIARDNCLPAQCRCLRSVPHCSIIPVLTKKNSSHHRAIYGGPSEKFVGVLGGIFRSCPQTSQKLSVCGNLQTQRVWGQILRSLLQNPQNFSEVAPEVRPPVHTLLNLRAHGFSEKKSQGTYT